MVKCHTTMKTHLKNVKIGGKWTNNDNNGLELKLGFSISTLCSSDILGGFFLFLVCFKVSFSVYSSVVSGVSLVTLSPLSRHSLTSLTSLAHLPPLSPSSLTSCSDPAHFALVFIRFGPLYREKNKKLFVLFALYNIR